MILVKIEHVGLSASQNSLHFSRYTPFSKSGNKCKTLLPFLPLSSSPSFFWHLDMKVGSCLVLVFFCGKWPRGQRRLAVPGFTPVGLLSRGVYSSTQFYLIPPPLSVHLIPPPWSWRLPFSSPLASYAWCSRVIQLHKSINARFFLSNKVFFTLFCLISLFFVLFYFILLSFMFISNLMIIKKVCL